MLHVFTQTSIQGIFTINNGLSIVSVELDIKNDGIIIQADFNTNIFNKQITISFLPNESFDERYFATPQS